MASTSLHPRLRAPQVEKGNIVSQLVLDVTVYLSDPTVDELDFIVNLYRQVCPPDRFVAYAMEETVDWDDIGSPILTRLGRDAERRGLPLPFLDVVRRRIYDGRRFTLQFWDALECNSYSLNIRRVRVDDEHHAFARFTFPLDTEPAVLELVAKELAEHVALHSGHGGYCLSYDPWRKFRGFTINYGRAKRWWGLDVEDLNGTLPLMADRMKGSQWITILGPRFASNPEVAPLLETGLHDEVRLARCVYGTMLVAGPHPRAGDQHQPSPGLDAYAAIGGAIAAVTVDQHPDFDGEHFTSNGDTVGWLRRFAEPDGWR